MRSGLDPTAHARDPMLAYALHAHQGLWPANYPMHMPQKAALGLPEMKIEKLRHQMAWQTPDGRVRRDQEWMADEDRWHATASIPDRFPDTVVAAMVGRTLSEVVDLPGAHAWTITGTAVVNGFHVDLVLERVADGTAK